MTRLFSLVPRRWRISLIACGLVVSGLYPIYDVYFEDSNFRIITADTFYRSAQPYDNNWQELYAEAPFKSVINLRGPNPGKDWYGPEMAFAAKNTIQHYDIALSAHRKPDMATMEKLVAMMRGAPKPLLIHCKQGADRSGLASALYAYAIEGKSAEEAKGQLSLWYGHFRWWNGTVAMDKAFAEYVGAHPQAVVFRGSKGVSSVI